MRYVGNRSSGRMGVALAEEARRRGADVTLLAANLAVPAPPGVDGRRDADRGGSRARGARAGGRRRRSSWPPPSPTTGPPRPSDDKRPKDGEPWTVELEPTTDVLAALGAARARGAGARRVRRGRRGDRGLERAREKRLAKNADLFVFNDVSRADIGFDAPDNEVVSSRANGERHVAKAPKRDIAAAVLDEVERLLSTA